ncbi:MFS transporter [Streptomyces sp. NPDC001083]|uniref:MFS transporter n=1 Tax=Streptomyces sp. NPDC001083 TaxID=3364545 RepID=UPI0036D00E26
MASTTSRKKTAAARRGLAPGLIFVNLVGALISSLGAPLIPDLAVRQHVSLSTAQWSLTVTILVSVAATPLMGRIGDGPRRRPVILIALTVVVLGSVLAAVAPSFGWLLVGRGMQGLGQGLTPLTIAVARSSLSDERAAPTVGLLSITNAAGVGLGYPVTGLMAQQFGASGAFWFGTAVSAGALFAAWMLVPRFVAPSPRRVDVLGAGLLAASLACGLLAATQGPVWGWASGGVLLLFCVAAVLGAVWVWHQLHTPHPVVELRLLRHRAVLTADLTVLAAGIGMYLLLSLTTRLAQAPPEVGGLGASLTVSGLLLLPLSVGSVVAAWAIRLTLARMPSRLRLPAAALIMFVAMALFTAFHQQLWQIVIVMIVAGLGIGVFFSLTPQLIIGAVPAEETASAMSFNQVLRYVGYSIGSALSAIILQAHSRPGKPFPDPTGYTTAGAVTCAIWLLACLVVLLLSPSRPADPPDEAARRSALPALPAEQSVSGSNPRT